MLPNFHVYMISKLVKRLLVVTSYGPLFLDEDDFNKFDFEPEWLFNNIDTEEAYDLLCRIKIYYAEQAAKLNMEG